jgi:RNA-directed DNA polymerase
MIKASDDVQDLRRRIYVKAKAEPSWRVWVYTYVCSGAIGLRLGTME